METKKQIYELLEQLKDGEKMYFNMFEDGGALCYKCNGMYLLFEIPQYGGEERYVNTYFENQLIDLINCAYKWT